MTNEIASGTIETRRHPAPGYVTVTSNLPEANAAISIVMHWADAFIVEADIRRSIHHAQLAAAGWAEGDLVKKPRGTKVYKIVKARPDTTRITETEFEFWEVFLANVDNPVNEIWAQADNLEKVNQ